MDDIVECAERFVNDVSDLESLAGFIREEIDFVVDHKHKFRFAYETALRQRFGYHDFFVAPLDRLGTIPGSQIEPEIRLQDCSKFAFQCIAVDILEFLRTCREKQGYYGAQFMSATPDDATSLVPIVAKMIQYKRALLWHGAGGTPLTREQTLVLSQALSRDESSEEFV